MFNRFIIFFVAVFTVLTMASSAQAESFNDGAPMTDGLILAAVTQADAFWTSTGATMPAATVVTYTTGIQTETARAEQGGTRIGFTRGYVKALRKALARGQQTVHRLTTLCNTAVHERGHNLGLGHSDDPKNVMNATADVGPGSCIAWAIKVDRAAR